MTTIGGYSVGLAYVDERSLLEQLIQRDSLLQHQLHQFPNGFGAAVLTDGQQHGMSVSVEFDLVI